VDGRDRPRSCTRDDEHTRVIARVALVLPLEHRTHVPVADVPPDDVADAPVAFRFEVPPERERPEFGVAALFHQPGVDSEITLEPRGGERRHPDLDVGDRRLRKLAHAFRTDLVRVRLSRADVEVGQRRLGGVDRFEKLAVPCDLVADDLRAVRRRAPREDGAQAHRGAAEALRREHLGRRRGGAARFPARVAGGERQGGSEKQRDEPSETHSGPRACHRAGLLLLRTSLVGGAMLVKCPFAQSPIR
jgi:hypothetical protein